MLFVLLQHLLLAMVFVLLHEHSLLAVVFVQLKHSLLTVVFVLLLWSSLRAVFFFVRHLPLALHLYLFFLAFLAYLHFGGRKNVLMCIYHCARFDWLFVHRIMICMVEIAF